MSSPEKFAKSITPELFAFLFAIPVLLGLGEHWDLEDNESEELGKTSWMLIGSLPKSDRKKVEERIAKYAPLLMMLLSFITILVPRINKTIDDRRLAKAKLLKFPKGVNNNEHNIQNAREGNEASATESTANRSETGSAILQVPFLATNQSNPAAS